MGDSAENPTLAAKDADRMGHSSSGDQECPPHKSCEQEPTGVTDTESNG